MPREPLTDDEGEVRELTLEDMQAMRPFSELHPELQDVLSKLQADGRSKSREAGKEAVTLRLDPDIVHHFRAGGPDWQNRINKALRDAISRGT